MTELSWWFLWSVTAIWLFARCLEALEKLIFHRHEFTNHLTVSGYGYTEYEVWFCQSCPKVFGKQTKNFNQ